MTDFVMTGWSTQYGLTCRTREAAQRRAEAFAKERGTTVTLFEVLPDGSREKVCVIPKPEGTSAPVKKPVRPVDPPNPYKDAEPTIAEPSILDLIEEISLLG